MRFERKRSPRVGKAVRISMLVVFLGLMVMVIVVYNLYSRIFIPNVTLESGYTHLYIPTGSDFEYVTGLLEAADIVDDRKSFSWVATRKGYDRNVKPGRYRIEDGISNNELVNLLRSGKQDPVQVVFNNVRSLDHIAGRISNYLEPDSGEFSAWFSREELPAGYGFSKTDFSSMFIPNTYEFFWNTTPEQFTERMNREYEKFWHGDRDRKAKSLQMTRTEVITLASIVDEETLFDDENPRVAGVYINRLRRGIPLQADPTLRFALGDFSINRIVNAYKVIDSPYNTYKNRGLPPGPISIPSISAIDGVLRYEDHNYLYFCAKADFSGYHAFASTLSEHNRNARQYQQALNRNRVYR